MQEVLQVLIHFICNNSPPHLKTKSKQIHKPEKSGSDKIQNTKFWLPFLNCKIQEKPTRNIRLRYLAFLAVILKQ